MPLMEMEEIGINSHAISLKKLGETDDIYVRKMKARQFLKKALAVVQRHGGLWE